MLHGAWYESDQWSFSIPNVSQSLLNDNHGMVEIWQTRNKGYAVAWWFSCGGHGSHHSHGTQGTTQGNGWETKGGGEQKEKESWIQLMVLTHDTRVWLPFPFRSFLIHLQQWQHPISGDLHSFYYHLIVPIYFCFIFYYFPSIFSFFLFLTSSLSVH